jgi:hypothetical protein
MNKIYLTILVTLLCSISFSATIKNAKYDTTTKDVILDVVYSGGCGTHRFYLKPLGCFETMPVQCRAELIDESNDPCEALISNTIRLDISAYYNLGDQYYQDASLTILGDFDANIGKCSEATVELK